eukprot:2015549-Karenia_brevis.AAC.1
MAPADVTKTDPKSSSQEVGIEKWSPNELIEIASGCKCNGLSMTEYVSSKPLQDAVLRSKKGSVHEKNLLRSYIKAKEALATLEGDLCEFEQSGMTVPTNAPLDVTKKKGTKRISFERLEDDAEEETTEGSNDSTPLGGWQVDSVDVSAMLKVLGLSWASVTT